MTESAPDLCLVRVSMTDNLVGNEPAFQLWVAAVPREQAVAAVLERVPSHYTAELTEDFVSLQLTERLGLKAGDVCELSSAT